ncbi:hypothetical protein VHEMI02033 [[Torrubiella] hemipterigena]|uniref:Uncharacterized protein n=1 Tax=[Torrubiella] hemipterigena TaxID=1531966 RepID=A0A0A1T6Z6_9HYPO|nr:hypothetical protein VHEMI02033 [[Torrubiella] hemipterigena]
MARLSNPPPPAPEEEDDTAMPDVEQHSAATTTAAAPPSVPEAEPVIPGPRAQRLLDLYARSLSHTMGKLSWDNFAACYPTFARRNEPVLKQIQQQMVIKLKEKCEAEFESIVKTRNVVRKLNELEQIAADAKARRQDSSPSAAPPQPPHTLPPQTILAAHLQPAITASQTHLNARLESMQAQNALLADQVKGQRAEIDALLSQAEAAVRDVRGANAALGPLVDELAKESRAANV